MAENVAHFTESDFDTQVLQADKPVLVDFWAEWCGPCRMIAPVIEEIAAAYKGRLIVGKVNVDEDTQLAARYRVNAIPTLILFAKGKVAKQITGFHDKKALMAEIDLVVK